MRGVALEMGYVNNALDVWTRAAAARRARLAHAREDVARHREAAELLARNRTIQVRPRADQTQPLIHLSAVIPAQRPSCNSIIVNSIENNSVIKRNIFN